jgi:aconitase A
VRPLWLPYAICLRKSAPRPASSPTLTPWDDISPQQTRTYLATAARENLNLLQADEGSEKHYDDIITDHISPAGPWYKYRGHLENISNNLLTGAQSAIGSKTVRGETLILITNTVAAISEVAKYY